MDLFGSITVPSFFKDIISDKVVSPVKHVIPKQLNGIQFNILNITNFIKESLTKETFTISLVGLFGAFTCYAFYTSSSYILFWRMRIPGPSPSLIFGTLKQETAEGFFSFQRRNYEKYKSGKVYGLYRGNNPTMVICNLDIIKLICLNRHDNFSDRFVVEMDEPLSYTLPQLKGDQWRQVRKCVTRCFVPSRLKRLEPHVKRTALQMVEYVMYNPKNVDLQELFRVFSLDTLASLGFSSRINSFLEGPNNDLNYHLEKLKVSKQQTIFVNMFPSFIKPLLRLIGIGTVPSRTNKFFRQFVDRALRTRQLETRPNRTGRSDFLDLMLDSEDSMLLESQNTDRFLKYQDLQGQLVGLALSGHLPVARTLAFTVFLLAKHPEVMEKVFKEIDENLNGQFPSFDSVQSLEFLDMCMSEAMRMYPPDLTVDRVVKEDCKVMGLDIPKGITVTVPIVGIHYDPDIWEDPEKFMPERFQKTQTRRHPCSYIPFGFGQRNCVGKRFASLEMKTALVALLQKFKPTLSEGETTDILLEDCEVKAKNGLWVKFEERREFVYGASQNKEKFGLEKSPKSVFQDDSWYAGRMSPRAEDVAQESSINDFTSQISETD